MIGREPTGAPRGLDANYGTPVLDIKPYITGFAPRGTICKPA